MSESCIYAMIFFVIYDCMKYLTYNNIKVKIV